MSNRVSIKIPDRQDPVFMPVHTETTAEEMVTTLCQMFKIKPVARHIFALKFVCKGNLWAACNTNLMEHKDKQFEFRVRFRPRDFKELEKTDFKAHRMFFHQVKEDIRLNRVPYSSEDYDKVKDEIIGLSIIDMYRAMVERNKTPDLIIQSYKEFATVQTLRRHKFFIKKPMLDGLKMLDNTNDVHKAMNNYLEQAEPIIPHYMTEEFDADVFIKQDVFKAIRIYVNPYHEEMPGIRYHFSKHSEVMHFCTISELSIITLRSEELRLIELSRTNGAPFFVRFPCISSMISFVSLLDGYYRLSVNWWFNLCKALPSPSLSRFQEPPRCQGPVKQEIAYAKLRENFSVGNYLLREDENEYNLFHLDVCCRNRIQTYDIKFQAEGIYSFSGTPDDEQKYQSIRDLVNSFKNPNGLIYFGLCIRFRDQEKTNLLLCKVAERGMKEFKESINDKGTDHGPACIIQYSELNPLNTDSESFLKSTKNGVSQIFMYVWKKPNGEKIRVALKKLKPDFASSYTEEFLELANKWIVLRSREVVRILGVVLSPFTFVTPYYYLGPLDEYLRANRDSITCLDLIEAATYLARAMWQMDSKTIVHGRVRCHKIFVSYRTDSSFITCLSDPGIHKKYSTDEHPWLPPEYFDNPEMERTLELDVWAFGTTLWEIFSFGEIPVVPMEMKTFYREGNRLPDPPIFSKVAHISSLRKLIHDCWHHEPYQRKRPHYAMRDIYQLLSEVSTRTANSYVRLPPDYSSSRSSLSLDSYSCSSSIACDFNGTHSEPSTVPCDEDLSDLESISSYDLERTIRIDENLELHIMDKIDTGISAFVHKGIVTDTRDPSVRIDVAVKRLFKENKEDVEGGNFDREMSIMKSLRHTNIVQLKYVILESSALVMEYVPHGSLKSYVVRNKEKLVPQKHFVKYALDIAEGMQYLKSKKVVHRDLAARNVLVADEFSVKISDFGLSQYAGNDSYYHSKTSRFLPYLWLPPEALKQEKFSSQSDVWSYGVTLYEMFTFGEKPEIHEECDNSLTENNECLKQLEILKSGSRLPQPEACPTEVFKDLMAQCWEFEAMNRPTFEQLVERAKRLWKESTDPTPNLNHQ